MSGLLRVEGIWPGPITINAGWFRARARPWNEMVEDPMIRLDRGGAEFLVGVVRALRQLDCETIYSPALYSSATRVWNRAGFDTFTTLDIMEMAVGSQHDAPDDDVLTSVDPNWDPILDIDRAAFDGFWGMSAGGLTDAFTTNKTSILLTVGSPVPVGYALLGSQWGVAYLHRIAVDPQHSGLGLGRSLMSASLSWAFQVGAKTMILNVRRENQRATRLYERMGFVSTNTALEVLQQRRRC